MILDADVVIALLDDQDALHPAAADVVAAATLEPLRIHPLTLAEALVVPARHGREDAAFDLITGQLGVMVTDDPPRLTLSLARARHATRLRMPDCLVLVMAELLGEPLATFDNRLARVAGDRGVMVWPSLPVG